MLDDEKGDFVGTAVREVSILASEYSLALILFLPGFDSEFQIAQAVMHFCCSQNFR